MNDISRYVRWFVINGLFYVALYYGFFENIEAAKNIALFFGWITGILGTFVFIVLVTNEEKVINHILKNGYTPPSSMFASIDLINDLIVIAIFVAFSHEVLAVFYFFQVLALYSIYHTSRNQMGK